MGNHLSAFVQKTQQKKEAAIGTKTVQVELSVPHMGLLDCLYKWAGFTKQEYSKRIFELAIDDVLEQYPPPVQEKLKAAADARTKDLVAKGKK